MSQSTRKFQQPEEWANFIGADIVTNGLSQFFFGLLRLFVKLLASLSLVFIRARTGTRFISLGTLIWGMTLMGCFWFAEGLTRFDLSLVTGESSGWGSIGLIWLHMLAFGAAGFYRFWEARRNLRNETGTRRFSEESGYSVLLPFFTSLLVKLNLIDEREMDNEFWYQIEYRFQKFGEPAIIFIIGLLVALSGFGVYGTMLMLSGLATLCLFIFAEDAFYKYKQDQWDARLVSEVVSDVDQPVEREKGLIIQQTLMRNHDTGFRAWKEEQDVQSYFTTANRRSDNGVHSTAGH